MKKPTGLGRALLVAASHCACAHTLACGDFISLHIHQTAADCLPSFEPEAMLGQGQGVESSGNPHAFVEFWGELCPECIFGLLFRLVKRYFFFAQNFIITP
jgi:hypothetical protein